MNDLGFLLDENVPLAIQAQLRQREPSIRASVVGQPGVHLKGTSDIDLLIWIEKQGFVLVTRNRASMLDPK